MELTLNIEKLHLKSEYLHTNPKFTYYHEDSENPFLLSWDDCVTVLYSLDALADSSLWNPIECMVSLFRYTLSTYLMYFGFGCNIFGIRLFVCYRLL